MAKRQQRNEQISEARKKQIMDASMIIFAAKGYGEATVADIAKAAGVSIGTIYHYYKDKRDLLLSLLQQTIISDSLVSLMQMMSTIKADDLIEPLFTDRLNLGMTLANILPFLLFEIQRDTKLRKQFASQVVTPQLSKMEGYLRQQIESGHIRNVDEKVVIRIMLSIIIGLTLLYRLEGRDGPLRKSNTNIVSKEISQLLLNGLLKR
jgi:AcrR family transcriptional regulator